MRIGLFEILLVLTVVAVIVGPVRILGMVDQVRGLIRGPDDRDP